MKEKKKAGWFCRLMNCVWNRDRAIFGLCGAYTPVAAAAPFCSVLLSRGLVALLTGGQATPAGVCKTVGLFFAAAALLYFMREWLKYYAYPRITLLRIDYVRDQAAKLLGMDYPYCEDENFENRYSRALRSTSSNSNGVEGVLHQLFELPALALGVLALAAFVGSYAVWVLPVLMLHMAATLAGSFAVQRFEYEKKEEKEKHDRRVYYFSDTTLDFSYGKDLRLYGLCQRVLQHFEQEIRGYIAVAKCVSRREFRLAFIPLFTLLLSDGLTYGLLVRLVVRGMPIADFTMLLTASLALSALLTQLTDHIVSIRREGMYVKDLYEFFDADLSPCRGASSAFAPGTVPDIEFRHVTFRYPGAAKNVFTDFSLRIPAGQKLALVGVNGAGKTTFVKLLTGLFSPDSGDILLNGCSIREWPREELWKMFGVVFQEVTPLAFTVAENVAYASKDIDRPRVEWALREAGLYDKVASFEKGIDQPLLKVIDENGTLLSGGEAQKLAIARALYRGADIMILDEPTAALDALAEAAVYEQFDRLAAHKTTVFISHRLASTRFCDVIALLDGETLCEYGTHEQLMEKKGLYCEMFRTQGKYYREDGLGEEESVPV